jgi:hypothetical protein
VRTLTGVLPASGLHPMTGEGDGTAAVQQCAPRPEAAGGRPHGRQQHELRLSGKPRHGCGSIMACRYRALSTRSLTSCAKTIVLTLFSLVHPSYDSPMPPVGRKVLAVAVGKPSYSSLILWCGLRQDNRGPYSRRAAAGARAAGQRRCNRDEGHAAADERGQEVRGGRAPEGHRRGARH